ADCRSRRAIRKSARGPGAKRGQRPPHRAANGVGVPRQGDRQVAREPGADGVQAAGDQLQVLVAADPAFDSDRLADLRLAQALRAVRSRGVRDLLAMLHDAVLRRADGSRATAGFGGLAVLRQRGYPAAAHLQATARRLQPVALLGIMADDDPAGVHRRRPDAVPQPAADARRARLSRRLRLLAEPRRRTACQPWEWPSRAPDG